MKNIVSEKAKKALENKKIEQNKIEKEIKKEKSIFNKYIEYAFENICPSCGKIELVNPDEVHTGINGEYGNLYCWFNCSCGFKYVGGDIEGGIEKIDEHIKWYKNIIDNEKVCKKIRWWEFWKR